MDSLMNHDDILEGKDWAPHEREGITNIIFYRNDCQLFEGAGQCKFYRDPGFNQSHLDCTLTCLLTPFYITMDTIINNAESSCSKYQ